MYPKNRTHFKTFAFLPIFKWMLVFLFLWGNSLNSFGQDFQEIQKIIANDGEIGDDFGFSVAIFDDYIIVGAHSEDTGGTGAGAAYIFQKDTEILNNWIFIKKIQASDKGTNDSFGWSVSISSNYAIVGAYTESTGGINTGAVYVFGKDEGGVNNWGEVKKIQASDKEASDLFGYSVSISDNYVIVGALQEDTGGSNTGAAYIFEKDEGGPNNWGEVKKIQASDKEAGDFFGVSTSIFGNTIIIGASREDSGGDNIGAAYIFEKDEGGINNWGEVKKIQASDKETGDRFGGSVSIFGNSVIVGALQEDSGGSNTGAAYIFEKDEGGINNWGEVKKIQASDKEASDLFGYSVSISNKYAVVGVPFKMNVWASVGAAYIFGKDKGGMNNWGEIKKIEGNDITLNNLFGRSVSISDDYIIAGAEGNSTNLPNTGAAYIFKDVNQSTESPKIMGDLEYCSAEENTTLDVGDWSNYQWSNGASTQTISVIEGTYAVTVTNNNGVTGTDQVTVIKNENPNPSITGNLEYCGSAENTILDVGNWSSYLWSNGATSQTIAATEGMYSVEVTDDNGCMGISEGVIVVENENLNPSITGSLEYCGSEGNTILDAGNWSSYLWSNGATNQTIAATEGTYSVEVTNSNGCSGTSDAVTVVENNSLTPIITGGLEYCGSAGNTILDVGNWSSYLWSNGATNQTIAATEGTYSVEVTNSNGCSGTSDAVTVVENNNPTPIITGDLEYCGSEGNTILDAGNWSNYLWSNGETSQTIAATEGTYSIEVTDSNGCSGTSDDVTVVENDNPIPVITSSLEEENTVLDAGNWSTYLWSNGATSQTILVTEGTYSVEVTDSNDCLGVSDNVTIGGESGIDLELIYSVNPTNYTIFTNSVFMLTITNKGPETATGITVHAPFTNGLSYTSNTPSQGTYSLWSNTWNVGTLASGASATLDLSLFVLNVDTDLSLFAQVQTANESDSDSTPGNNNTLTPIEDDEASVTTSPAGSGGNMDLIDLELTKTVSNSIAENGDQITYTLSLNNTGANNASNVEVEDILPSGLGYVTSTASNGTYSNTTGVWTIGTLNAGGSESLDIVVNVSDISNPITNFAQVKNATGNDLDSTPNNGNGTTVNEDDEASVVVFPAAIGNGIDLELDISCNVSEFSLYESVIYTISVTNKGPATATGVKIANSIPSGMAFTSKTESKGNFNLWLGEWTIGSLNADETATLELTLFVLDNSSAISNFAQVKAANEGDVDSTPNSSTGIPIEDDEASVTIVPIGSNNNQIDLALSKTANVGSAQTGDNFTYQLTIVNNGTTAATGVTVEDILPSNLTYTGSVASKGGYDEIAGIWNIGTLGIGAAASLNINVTVNSIVLPITNFAQVKTANETDVDSTPNSNNGTTPQEDDEDSVVVLVDNSNNLVDLELTKTANVSMVNAGDEVIYTLTVTNNGSVDAIGVTVEDELPNELSFDGASASKGTYSFGSGIWSIGNVAVNETVTVDITTTVNSISGSITNFAQISTASPDDSDSTPNNDSNQTPNEDDEDSATILSAGSTDIDLEAEMIASSNSVVPWTNVVFTLEVTNNSTNVASGVLVDFPVPDGMAFTSKSESIGNYNLWSQTWNIGVLQPNETAVLELNLFTLNPGTDITTYAEVTAANEMDIDSTPNNGNGSSAVEDDEAATTLSNGGGGKIDLNANIVGRSALLTVNRIYPIPTNDVVNIIFTSKTENVAMILYDFSGRVVYERTLEVVQGENVTQIDLTSFPSGWYFVSMETEDGNVRAKMVKQ